MIEAFPEHPQVARWREAIELWVEDYVLQFTGRNPFGWLPYAFYPEPPADNPDLHYRPFYPHPWECSDEYYGYQSSQYLWAVLSLQTLDL